MDNTLVSRINELARLNKVRGLTEAEKAEQSLLRDQYIAAIRRQVETSLSRLQPAR